jgi:hypothetical protein
VEELNFWDYHGWAFIIFMLLFPRLTMLATGIWMKFLGLWFFLGWLFMPRLTTAILAIHFYWDQNPVICVLACLLVLDDFGGGSDDD